MENRLLHEARGSDQPWRCKQVLPRSLRVKPGQSCWRCETPERPWHGRQGPALRRFRELDGLAWPGTAPQWRTRNREPKLEAVVTGSDKVEGRQAPSVNGRRPGASCFVKILWRWACHAGAGAIEAPLCFAPLATPDRQSQLGLAYLAPRSMFRSLNRLGLRIWGMPRQPRTEGFVS